MKRIIIIGGLLFIGLLVNSNINMINSPSPSPSPSPSSTMYIDSEIFMESDIDVEGWMTKPFLRIADRSNHRIEHRVYEERLEVEDWMTHPFDTRVDYEEPLELEDWMTKPFNV